MKLLEKLFSAKPGVPERRRSPRKNAVCTVWIADASGRQPQICLLRDLSEGGAKISLSDSMWVPEECTLLLSFNDTSGIRCRTVWSGNGEVGLEFLSPADRLLDRLYWIDLD